MKNEPAATEKPTFAVLRQTVGGFAHHGFTQDIEANFGPESLALFQNVDTREIRYRSGKIHTAAK